MGHPAAGRSASWVSLFVALESQKASQMGEIVNEVISVSAVRKVSERRAQSGTF